MKMIPRDELMTYCNGLLDINAFKDYCPNGLQVEGASKVRHVIGGVSASQALLEVAVERGADTVLVHHGYFWRGEDNCVKGIKRQRLAILLQHNINLLAYHLPLDAHPQLGNNAGLGKAMGFAGAAPLAGDSTQGLLWQAELEKPLAPGELARQLEQNLGRAALHIDAGPAEIQRVIWCTGGAQGYIDAAADAGADAYITGEVSEQTVHIARERGVHFYAAGHHATERFGVRSLLAHLTETFALQTEFIDVWNPV